MTAEAGRRAARMLFFSGGSALKTTSEELARRGADTAHLITTFDSGGSSATLRRAFAMPAVGDVRARILALADTSRPGIAEIYALFAYRLPEDESPKRVQAEMASLARGSHPLLRQVPEPLNGILREHLIWFALHMPAGFPLAGANVGNLVLTAGYVRNQRRLGPVIALFSRLVHARGAVRPIAEDPAHLAVRLASGELIVGQHRFTGKEAGAVSSRIEDIWLAAAEDSPLAAKVGIRPRTARLIRGAGGICYPVGSFYSSVVANLLPEGVGRAVADNPCVKVFVPNLGADPELLGHSLLLQVERLLRPLLADAPGARPADVLSLLLVDRERGNYPGGIPDRELAALGIGVRHAPLLAEGGTLASPRLLAEALLGVFH